MSPLFDDQIHRVHRSSETLIHHFAPLHDALRQRSPWYYRWHMHPYAHHVHWGAFTVFVLACLISIASLFAGSPQSSQAAAGILKQFPFQGYLTDTAGKPVADGEYDLTFRLYDTATEGTAAWTEAHTGANKVTVSKGVFTVLLGGLESLAGIDFNTDTWFLGIQIGSGTELAPRIRLGAVPFALNSDKLDGKDETNFALLDGRSGGQTVTGGTGSGENLTLQSTSSSTKGKIFLGSGAAFDQANTRLGIGNTTPNATIDLTPLGADALRINPFGTGTGSTGQLEFTELAANGGNFVGFKAPDSIGSNVIFTLPGADGSSGQVLSTNGSGALSFTSLSTDAPTDPSYVTLSTNGTLSGERVLTGTSNQITVTDGGAGGNVTLSAPQDLHTGASPTFTGLTLSGSSFNCSDCANFDDLADALTLDAATTIALGANNFTINLDSTGTFAIQDGGSAVLAVDADGKTTISDDLAVTLADSEAVTITTTIASGALNVFDLSITNNTGSGVQRAMRIDNAVGSGVTDALLLISNSDTDTAVTDGLAFSSAAGGLTNAIEASGANVTHALKTGDNFILFDGIRAAELATGTLTFEDTSGNDLLTLADGGTTGNVNVTGNLQIGGGTAITKHLSATASLNLGTPGAVPGCTEDTITVTGAALGDTAVVSMNEAPLAASHIGGFVSSSNTVTVRICKFAGAAADPDGADGATYRADVWQH